MTQHASTYAALDLGSNSFHLLVTKVHDDQWQVLDTLKHTVRLAEGLRPDGTLDEKIKQRALDSLRQMAQRLVGVPAENTRVVGTKALRAASADRDFLKRAEATLGRPIEVISGREEARLLYHGVRHSLPPFRKNRLVMDIGGASTELIIGREHIVNLRESLNMGCVAFTRRFFTEAKSRREFQRAWSKTVLETQLTLRPYRHQLLATGWHQAGGASGTFRATARILAATGWSSDGISREGLEKLASTLLSAGPGELDRLPGLSDRRRPVFAAGLAIIHGLFESLDLENLTVANGALREGVVLDLSGRTGQHDIRETSVATLARRFSVDTAQARRLQSVIDGLLTIAGKRLLKKKHRASLRWAVALHEVGLGVAHAGFHRHGAYLVANADMPGFSRTEQAWLAFLIRMQKGKPPAETPAQVPPVGHSAQLPLLRTALAVCRARHDDWLSFLQAVQKVCWQAGTNTLELTLDAEWLTANPLIAADLKKTARQLSGNGPAGSLKILTVTAG